MLADILPIERVAARSLIPAVKGRQTWAEDLRYRKSVLKKPHTAPLRNRLHCQLQKYVSVGSEMHICYIYF